MGKVLRARTLGIFIPLGLIAIILGADALEGPKTAYVGVLAVVPMLAAVFAPPAQTFLVGVITWCSAYAFGYFASDGNVTAQTVRLFIIAVTTLVAAAAAATREREEERLSWALHEAALAEELRIQAERDHLTGLLNRRGALAAIEDMEPEALRVIALLDCDNLKAVNDEHGHAAGDAYLRAIAGRIKGVLPEGDLVARWGGDEFLVVQVLGVDQAQVALQRVMDSVSGSELRLPGASVLATMSVGLTRWSPGTPLNLALVKADRALYEAKATGRNRIVVA